MDLPSISRLTRSVLRYPGGKARLAPLIAETIVINDAKEKVFAEPFCGGAAVSIALLEAGVVGRVALNDSDPLVAALWKCIFSEEANRLVDAIEAIPITLEQWDYQKRATPTTILGLAVKCLFLNRTSFSGILRDNAGPIGGRTQRRWELGCRFNKEKIISRILALSHLSERVMRVSNTPWRCFCEELDRKEKVFLYFDPPFYAKADRLYRHVFTWDDHKELKTYLSACRNQWILSYDNASGIRQLYSDLLLDKRIIDKTYAAHPIGGNSYVGREIIFSNCTFPNVKDEAVKHKGISLKYVDSVDHCRSQKVTFTEILTSQFKA